MSRKNNMTPPRCPKCNEPMRPVEDPPRFAQFFPRTGGLTFPQSFRVFPWSSQPGVLGRYFHRIISPPDGERNWERYITSRTNSKIAEAQARAATEGVK